MRRTLQVLTALFILFYLCAFGSYRQDSGNAIVLLDRSGKPATRITDGDTVRLQLSVAQPVTSPQTYTFKLDNSDLAVSTCSISTGTTCQSDPVLSLGWHWDAGGVPRGARALKAYDAQGNLIAHSAPVTVLARPVVLVHGFLSSADTWKSYLGPTGYLASLGLSGFAVGDGQASGVMNTGVFTNPTGHTNTMAQNAAIEAQYISEVKKATGAQMVDLVVHSMGGMISRYYIDRLMPDRDVAQLIMLGSPMGGSDCSVLPASLGFFLPASLEIRQSYMEGVFNRQITHRRGVEFYDLGGTAINKAFQSPCAAVPNDIAVSVESVNAIPLHSSTFDILHSELTSSSPVFDSFVRPLLEKPSLSFPFAPDPAPSGVAPPPLQFTRVYTGHVNAGGSSELSINIDPNVTVASFALYDPTRSVKVSVRGANGNALTLDAQANGFIEVKDPSSLVYLGYGFSDPRPGIWNVAVLASDSTPPLGADFAISAYFVGGAILNAKSSTLIPRLGEHVQFTADLSLDGQPLDILKAQAVLRGPAGQTESIDFTPGTQVSASWTPRTVGTHGVDIIVTGRAPDGSQIERTAFLSEEVQPNLSNLQ
ncbi:MAG: esterase/lipase family protein, partial [Anaerolineales bacterium]